MKVALKMKHVFKSECFNVKELFNECLSLDTFIANLRKQENSVKTSNYLRHGFEALVEAIILCEKKAIRLQNYEPSPSCINDLFVHGIGEKSRGNKVAIMACFVDDDSIPLTSNANHLTTFTSNAVEKFDVKIDEDKGMRIFTNAHSLHERTHEQFFNDKSVVFYLKSDIEKIVNGNEKFWTKFEKMMEREETGKTITKKDESGIKLRDYQNEASQAISDNSIGQIIMPTGTGKSLIAINAIYREISTIRDTNRSPCILIMTPRIVLTYQLLGDVINYFKANGTDAQYLNLNSGEFDDDKIKVAMADLDLPVRDIPSTTTVRELEHYYDKAVTDGVPFIISSTYQSAPRLAITKIPIHMAIYDEAHNLVIGRFSTKAKQKVLKKILAHKKVFLTATPAYAKDIKEEELEEGNEGYNGLGMENEQNYGKEIYRKSPKNMIDAGEIVPPYIHVVNVSELEIKGKVIHVSPDELMDEDIEKNVELMAKVIDGSFDEHLKQIKKHSCSPEKIGAKVIVVCSGDSSFRGFFASDGFTEMRERRKDIKFFGISSAYGAWIDGERILPQGGWFKEKFLLALRSLKQEDNAIIFHIDMLGEGIDVPGITGVIPFRELGTIKSCQTLGRAMRIVPEDRKSLYNGSRGPNDRDKMVKPYAWVILPVYSINHVDIKQKIESVVKRIRNDYDYKPSENFIIQTSHPPSFKPPELPKKSPLVDRVDMEQIIEDVSMTNAVADRQAEIMAMLRGNDVPVIQNTPAIETPDKNVYSMTYDGVEAKGEMRGDKFVVLAGSGVREKVNLSLPPCYMKIRSDILEQKNISEWKLTEDIEFKSPSAAASILMGSAIDGRITWKMNGKTLKEVEK